MTIAEIQNNTNNFSADLIKSAEKSFDKIIADLKSNQARGNQSNANERTSNGNQTVSIASLLIAAIGIIGWISSDSDSNDVWPKICAGGGVSLFLLNRIFGRRKHEKKPKVSNGMSHQEFAKVKIDVQDYIEDISSKIKGQWNDIASSNKKSMHSIIDSSNASADSKFYARNIASLPKHIQFSMIPYMKDIVGANSIDALAKVIVLIKDAFVADVRSVCESQIEDYENIKQKIS